jgi:choline dehydrogenase-like flavoprotein
MPVVTQSDLADAYDLVIIGSGFGALFFAHRALERRNDLRVVILEWGDLHDHAWQIANGKNTDIPARSTFSTRDSKIWNFTIGFGGGTNCWYAHAPRMHPSDFRTRTLYGVGEDWPFTYDEIEPYYCDAEEIMEISGPEDMDVVIPRSRPYPQPPHRFSSPDEAMKRAQPTMHFNMPTGRARIAARGRPACCSTARCHLCPVDAKFTVFNGDLAGIVDRADILLGARALWLDAKDGSVERVIYRKDNREEDMRGETFVLGANTIHSPAILLASGLRDPLTGVGINEQLGVDVEVMLEGVDNFDGSTITTGLNYSLYDGPFRRAHAGALLHFENRWRNGLRLEFGRWRQTLPITVVLENHPAADSRVTIDRDGRPVVAYAGPSAYSLAGRRVVEEELERILAPLPVEEIRWGARRQTESHMHGTLRMGRSRETSVVDGSQVHHSIRNLVVVGSSVFPTCPNSNPSLTVAALSLRAADKLYGSLS